MPASAIFVGTRRRRSRRPRRAPSGSTPSGGGGCIRAAASARPTRRPHGCDAAPAARRAAPLRAAPARAIDGVDGLQQLDLLLEGQVKRVAGRVREGAGLGDRADEPRDRAVVAAQLEDLLDDGAMLGLEFARAGRRGRLVGVLLDLHAEPPARIGLRRTAIRGARLRAGRRAPPGRRTRSVTRRRCPRRSRRRGAARGGRAPRPPRRRSA